MAICFDVPNIVIHIKYIILKYGFSYRLKMQIVRFLTYNVYISYWSGDLRFSWKTAYYIEG